MKTTLSLAIGSAALFAVGSASAQECVGGYMMLKDQIPVRCDVGPGPEQIGISPVQPLPEEPLYTGSINSLGTGGGNADEIPTAANSPEEPLYTGSINGLGVGGGNADEIPTATAKVDDSCWIATANSGVTLPRPCN